MRRELRGRLPEYMVPGVVMALEEMPLLPNGKVDRRKLPAPDGQRPEVGREYVEPRTETERKVAGICAELLKLDRVGVEDSFFELGGHSLLATQLLSRVRAACGAELPLRAIFESPTVAGLAGRIDAAQKVSAPSITAVSREARRVKRSSLGSSM